MVAPACLCLSRVHITSAFGVAFQEWPEWVPFDESALPAGNIPAGVHGPRRRRAVSGAAVSGERTS